MFNSIKESVRDLVETNPKGYSNVLRFTYPELCQYLKDVYPSRGEGLYCWLHGVTTPPMCKQCGVIPCTFNSIHNGGYREFCSTSCRAVYHKSYKNAHTPNGSLKPSAREKIIQAAPTSRVRARNTMLERYGHTSPIHVKQFADKKIATTVERYGVPNVSLVPGVRRAAERTCRIIYGDEHPARLDEFKDKVVDTNNKKYNRNHPSQQHISVESLESLTNPDWITNNHISDRKPVVKIADSLGVTPTTVLNYMDKMGIAAVRHPSSEFEREVVELLQQHYSGVIETNVRTLLSSNREIDIFIPALNLAIECNGVFWHGEAQGKTKHYHASKTEECSRLGIRLIHIFDTEWYTKRPIVVSRLKNVLGVSDVRMFARNVTVGVVTPKEAGAFCDMVHIQGRARSSVNLGLFDREGELVSVMTFGRPRYDNTSEYELIRFATALGTNIVGGASKLFTHFIRLYHPSSVVSYSDRRWNTGGVYQKLGLTQVSTTPPGYYYFKRNNATVLQHRSLYQKHMLASKLDTFDANISEYANMVANGYDRIWDCGTTKWVITC